MEIQVFTVLEPNTILGIDKEIKLRDVPFIVRDSTIEILDYINPCENIKIINISSNINNIVYKIFKK